MVTTSFRPNCLRTAIVASSWSRDTNTILGFFESETARWRRSSCVSLQCVFAIVRESPVSRMSVWCWPMSWGPVSMVPSSLRRRSSSENSIFSMRTPSVILFFSALSARILSADFSSLRVVDAVTRSPTSITL